MGGEIGAGMGAAGLAGEVGGGAAAGNLLAPAAVTAAPVEAAPNLLAAAPAEAPSITPSSSLLADTPGANIIPNGEVLTKPGIEGAVNNGNSFSLGKTFTGFRNSILGGPSDVMKSSTTSAIGQPYSMTGSQIARTARTAMQTMNGANQMLNPSRPMGGGGGGAPAPQRPTMTPDQQQQIYSSALRPMTAYGRGLPALNSMRRF
jgi:hypothetical protein